MLFGGRCLCVPLHGGPGTSIQLGPGWSGPGESSGGSRGGGGVTDQGISHTLWSTFGKQQPAQNRIGPGKSDCLIKT